MRSCGVAAVLACGGVVDLSAAIFFAGFVVRRFLGAAGALVSRAPSALPGCDAAEPGVTSVSTLCEGGFVAGASGVVGLAG
ncbi:MAG: hypothetical protein ACRDUB_08175 [Mycobacterium sp.]